jgi:MazG family protein
MSDIKKLLEIMKRLRDPQKGCPWDCEQSFETIAPYTIEEAYEVADAIERKNLPDLEDELGDLLFQVVYHARMAEEIGAFDFASVVAAICSKMTRRHPHVFGESQIASSDEQTIVWEKLKDEEKSITPDSSVLDDLPVGLPALTRAAKLGHRASRVGFDWPDIAGAKEKVAEELEELDEAVSMQDESAIQAEMGDVLFALVNVCRHLELDPEACLRSANTRFDQRFRHVERDVKKDGGAWHSFDLEALDSLWIKAKKKLQAKF